MRRSEARELVAWLQWLKAAGYLSPTARQNVDHGIRYYERFC